MSLKLEAGVAGTVGAATLATSTVPPALETASAEPSIIRPYSLPPWPLTFRAHDFASQCYNTLHCGTFYDRYNAIKTSADQPSGPPPSRGCRNGWKNASHVGIRAACAAVMVALTSLSMGCTVTPGNSRSAKVLTNEWPLRFREHNFASYCYNTRSCSVTYNQYDFTNQIKEQPPGSPSPADRNKWTTSHIGIANFPTPADVQWVDVTGKPHRANIDLAQIFGDRTILHKVPRDAIPEGWAHNIRPDIFLEVDGDTINVYMRAHIATKDLQIPGNRYSDFRDDTILAWSKEY